MEEKDKYFGYFLIIAVIILVVSLAFPFIVNQFFCSWSESGTFGDTYGALNAIFSGIAISGVIITILLQRKELDLQRKEMRDTRREFLINRTTNVIYNQLQRFEKAVEQFIIESDGKIYRGNDAIYFLDRSKVNVFVPINSKRKEEEILKERKEKNCVAMKLYSKNDKSIAQFALSAYNSVMVVKETLFVNELSVSEMNDLKNIFFRNVGFIHLDLLEDIEKKFHEYLELSSKEDNYFSECYVEYGELSGASIFLKSIVKFRKTIVTDEYVKEIKENWKREFGGYA